jgi:hypothetical protein
MKEKATSTPNDPLESLAAELECCRKAANFCMGIALGPGVISEESQLFAGKQVDDIEECMRLMRLAIELMDASSRLGEAIAKLKGEMRQSITVDRYEHGPASAPPPRNLSTRERRQAAENACALQHQGEGGGAGSEKQPGE